MIRMSEILLSKGLK